MAELAIDITPASIYQAFGPWLAAATAVFGAGGIAAFALFRRGTPAAKAGGIAALSLAMLLGLQLALVGHDAFAVVRSAYGILQDAQRANGQPFDPAFPVYQVQSYDQTLPFYLRRPTHARRVPRRDGARTRRRAAEGPERGRLDRGSGRRRRRPTR